MKQNSWFFVLVAALFMNLLFSGCSQKDKPQIKRSCFPVPMKVGDKTITSSLFLELDYIEYNKPYGEFIKNASTPEEKFIIDVFEMIAACDSDQAAKLIVPNSSIDNASQVKAPPDSLVSLLNTKLTSISNPEHLPDVIIGSCFFWQNLRVFTFASSRPKIDKIESIIIEEQDNKLVVPMGWPAFHHSITQVATQFYNDSELKMPRQDIVYDYAITYGPEETLHPAVFLFKGKYYDLHIPSAQIQSDDEIGCFYQQVVTDLKSASSQEDIRNLANYFDEDGKNRLLGWIEKDSEGLFKWIHRVATEDITLKYIINADPVFIISESPSLTNLHCIFNDGNDLRIFEFSSSSDITQILFKSDFRNKLKDAMSNKQ